MKRKKFLSILLAVAMVICAVPASIFAALSYDDTQNHWAEEAIDRWSEYEVVQGKGEGRFDPDGQMTRAEAAQVFANLLGLNKTADISEFKDVKNLWYKDAIAKCYAAGILNGKSASKMDPNGKITREEFMTMYARAICISNGNTETEAKEELKQKGYTDTNKVSNWAADAVKTLVDKGFVKGVSGTELAPKNNIDRASVMALLNQSVSTYVGKNSTETTITAKSEGITLIANPNVTRVTGNADVVVVAAGAEKYDEATGEIEHSDIKVESAKMPIARVEGENITVTLTINTQADDAEVTVTGVDSEIIVESTASVKNVTLSAEGSKATVAGKVETIKIEETAKEAVVDTKSTAKVETVENKAENTTVKGTGTVTEVKSSEDVKIETKNTKVENTNEEKQIAVTDSKGAETKVETKTESSSTGTTSETTVNKEEEKPSGGGGGGYTPPAPVHTHSYDATTHKCACGIVDFAYAVARIDDNYYMAFNDAYASVGAIDSKQINLLSVEGFKQFRNAVNEGLSCAGITIALDTDIDLNNETWTPIGTTTEHAFSGIFDGQNHTISKLNVNGSNGVEGLFGYVLGGKYPLDIVSCWDSDTFSFDILKLKYEDFTTVVKDFTVKNSNIVTNCEKKGTGVIGSAELAYVKGITVTGSAISGYKDVGGIVGSVNGSVVDNCYTSSDTEVSAEVYNVAGIVGAFYSAQNNVYDKYSFAVINCINNASIWKKGTGGYFGGIVGSVNVGADTHNAFVNCINNGNLNDCKDMTTNQVSGIVGECYCNGGSQYFVNCTNTGNITLSGTCTNAAGIVSRSKPYGVNLVNTGNITGNASGHIAGILASQINDFQFSACVNTGELTNSNANNQTYDICNSSSNVIIKDVTYTDVTALNASISAINSDKPVQRNYILSNVTVNDYNEALIIPNNASSFVVKKGTVCTKAAIEQDRQIVSVINIPNVTVDIDKEFTQNLFFTGANNMITINSTTAGIEVSGDGSEIIVNVNMTGGLTLGGAGTVTATIESGATVNGTHFSGTGNYTLTNYGTITNAGGGSHVVSTLSPCMFIVNNYGTIKNTKTNATYALLFYGNCNATFNATTESILSTDYANLIMACGSAGSVKFNYEEGAKIDDAGSPREYTSIKWGIVQVNKVEDISNFAN